MKKPFKRTIEENVSFISNYDTVEIDNLIIILNGLKDKGYNKVYCEVENDSDGWGGPHTIAIVFKVSREETDEEMAERLKKVEEIKKKHVVYEKEQKEKLLKSELLQYERLKKKFAKIEKK